MRKIITAFMMLLCAVCMASAANYLTFTAEEDSSSFGIVNKDGNNPDVQYSLDDGATWTALTEGDSVILAHKGDKALLKGNNPQGFSNRENYSSFTMTGKVAASGSVMSLIDGTGLSTEIPKEFCFNSLFKGCASLTNAPKLSAETLAEECYSYMFSGCIGLTQAPELPATNLQSRCYRSMFSGCTSLTQAPELPATLMENYCYESMFLGCTSLTQAPKLPATTMAYLCYRNMFSGCTSLTQAPVLPATTLTYLCYDYMFYGCTNLSEIIVSFDVWSDNADKWVKDVAPTGTFICPKALPLRYGESMIPEGWTVIYVEDINYLTFTAEEDGSSFGIVNNGYNNPDLQYSLDGGETWNALAAGDTITLAHKGDKALLRGDNPEGFSKGHGVYSSFTMTGKIAASGSVMSLNDGVGISTEVPGNFCFYKLFQGCTSLTQAPELPATILKDYCYADMFSGCTSLTEVPELPATALIDNCYNSMFKNCTGLTRAYLLFVDMNLNVRLRCLSEMFSGCTNLSEISVVFDEWSGYTQYWVYNVAPTGTFICPKGLPLEYGVSRIPEGWTVKYIDDTVAAETNYLTFTAEEDSSSFGIVNNGGNNPDVQYSLDGGKTWIALAGGEMVTLAHKGDKALLKGNNPEGFSKDWRQYSAFKMTGKVAASGSVMSLIDGLGLSTEILWEKCFVDLFENCTSLTQAPELPATVLSTYCYDGMFSGCTSLTQAPELPATILADNCYGGMFYHCTSLTQAPELPATTLAEGCYYEMFSGCTNLSEIKVSFDDWNDGDYTLEWVLAVAPTGTFICPKDLPLVYRPEGIPEGWTVKYIDDTVAAETNYLTFTAEEDGSTFGIACNYLTPDVQYSLNGGETWTELAVGDTILLAKKGDKALIRGYNEGGLGSSRKDYVHFVMTGTIVANGSVMSLIDGVGLSTKIPCGECFCNLFENCTSLTQAPELPATTLAVGCYSEMFSGCTSLTQAPELPATTLANNCYVGMFSGCTSLTQAPELPATEMTFYCYNGMFSGCTSLTKAPELPATSLSNYCYLAMFSGCTSLTKATELPATTLAEDCYASMFKGCTSLTEAPELPATTLAEYCYLGMFRGCTSLTQAPELPATTLAGGCYSSMFSGCTSLIRAPQISALTMDFRDCIAAMFSGCTNLSEISVVFDEWSVYTQEWVANVAPTGTFYCPKALPLEYGVSRIPEGWTVKYIEDEANYLTFTAEEDGSTFGIVNNGGNNPDIQYSLDGGETWTALAAGDTVTLAHKGDKALLRGDNPEGFSKDYEISSSFTMTGKIAASGSVMSLIDNTGETLVVPAAACFCKLFLGCTSLTEAPKLPATTLAEECYNSMFRGCTSLTQAPELPATTLAEACYSQMFASCTSLTQAPELPATTLASSCYNLMFRGCTSLTQAPELPATTLASSCYEFMFSGCTNLSEISVVFDEWSGYTQYWVYNVAPTGTFICPKTLPLEYGESRIPEGWTVKYIDDTVAAETNYLTFTAEEDGSTFGIVNNGKNNPDVQYSLDGGETWIALAGGKMVTLAHKGDKALLRGDNPEGFSKDTKKYSSFTMTGKIAASGSVMSLIDGMGKTLVVPAGDCFYSLFKGCTSLTQAPELPATTLAERCYNGMFSGCTSLTEAPELPAMTLANSCYSSMFYDCSSLTQAPELLATTLTESCYRAMFYGCTSLTQAPELPATTLAEYCYYDMFYGCTSLTQAPELPATTLADDCYNSMFRCCTSLTQAPELPATTLDRGCYAGMFLDCTRLTQAPELPAMTLAGGCYNSMFRGCTSLTQAPELPATTLASSCYEFMFSGCTSLTQAPELPATSLSNYCYVAMFLGCTSLTEAPKLPATTLAGGCYNSMFYGCTSLTEAPKLPATTLAEECYNSMFRGCTSLTQAPELPATTLAEACYSQMFASCTSLTQAPELPAPELIAHSNAEIACYREMFSGCTNLSEISVAFVEWGTSIFPSDENTYRWVKDVAPTGTFICPKTLPLEYGVNRIPEGWTVKYIEGEGSGVNTTLANNIAVWSDDLTIFVRSAEGEVSLYDMSGRIVATSNSKDEERALCVPSKGAYVVRTSGGERSVLVR